MSGVKDRIKMFETLSPSGSGVDNSSPTGTPGSVSRSKRPSSAVMGRRQDVLGSSVRSMKGGFESSPSLGSYGHKVSEKGGVKARAKKYEGKVSEFAKVDLAKADDGSLFKRRHPFFSPKNDVNPAAEGVPVQTKPGFFEEIPVVADLEEEENLPPSSAVTESAKLSPSAEESLGSSILDEESDSLQASRGSITPVELPRHLNKTINRRDQTSPATTKSGVSHTRRSLSKEKRKIGSRKSEKMMHLQKSLGSKLNFQSFSYGYKSQDKSDDQELLNSFASPTVAPPAKKKMLTPGMEKFMKGNSTLNPNQSSASADNSTSTEASGTLMSLNTSQTIDVFKNTAALLEKAAVDAEKKKKERFEAERQRQRKEEEEAKQKLLKLDAEKLVEKELREPESQDAGKTKEKERAKKQLVQFELQKLAAAEEERNHEDQSDDAERLRGDYTLDKKEIISNEGSDCGPQFLGAEQDTHGADILPGNKQILAYEDATMGFGRKYENSESENGSVEVMHDDEVAESDIMEEDHAPDRPLRPPNHSNADTVPVSTEYNVSVNEDTKLQMQQHHRMQSEIEQLKTELETERGRKRRNAEKEMERKERVEKVKEKMNLYVEKAKPHMLKGVRKSRFCIPSCGKMSLKRDERSEIFGRTIALLWLHFIAGFMLFLCAVFGVIQYSWTPQFSRAPSGLSLMVLLFFKAITSLFVAGSIYKNMDTAACMFPFKCYKSEYEPMIIYERDWLRHTTYGKLLDFAVGIWTWTAYTSANRIVGRPWSESLDALMFFIWIGLFLLDVWSLLLLIDMGALIRRWLEKVPGHHIRDGYTLHGIVNDSEDDEEEIDLSDSSSSGESDEDEEMGHARNGRGKAPRQFASSPDKKKSSGEVRVPTETPRTPLSKFDSARQWGAVTEREHNRPEFVPKLSLGSAWGKPRKNKSHLAGMPTFDNAKSGSVGEEEAVYNQVAQKEAEYQNADNLGVIEEEAVDFGGQEDMWDAHMDEYGQQYFVHRETLESVWEKPTANYSEWNDDRAATTEWNGYKETAEPTAVTSTEELTSKLSLNNEISPQEFEAAWSQMKVYSTVMLELNTVPPPNMVIEHVSSKGFRVIAHGVKDSKFTIYLFAKSYHEDAHFYAEIRFDSKTRHLTAVFKCSKKRVIGDFLSSLGVQDLAF